LKAPAARSHSLVHPEGRKETLLSAPRYDFNWESGHCLGMSLRLPAGTRIECTAHFDNSADNPNNHDPKKRVMWGDQTWEEMDGPGQALPRAHGGDRAAQAPQGGRAVTRCTGRLAGLQDEPFLLAARKIG
jgi:hypothetical protein